ncbi:MAG TPA: Hsp20/alpha crystallin family protein [Longilinea sp.]|nr:Hsp20/alpha crystallin family protein [Longilinea sp.]
MTYYISPMRMMRKRMLDQMMDNDFNETEREYIVPLDVRSEADGYVVTALVPGVNVDDLTIQVVNEALSIQGEFKAGREEGATYLMTERPNGKFYRTIHLPDPLDSANTEASLDNGILTIRVPKAEEARPKSIKINAK